MVPLLIVTVVAVLTGVLAPDDALARHTVVPPGPVTNLVATPGDSSITLSWKAPEKIGSASSIYYSVLYKVTTNVEWKRHTASIGSNTSTTVSSLMDGSYYEFRVYVHSTDGNSPWTRTSATAGIPSAPQDLKAVVGNSQVTLSWTVPEKNGGSAISDYVIEYRIFDTWTIFKDGMSTNTTATVTNLTNFTEYDFRVAARNQVNIGTWSTTIAATPVLPVPGAVTQLNASSGDSKVDLRWTEPVDGGPIDNYIIEYKETNYGSWIALSIRADGGTTFPISYLDNGISYDFRVAASNSAGQGPWSNTTTATPSA